MKKIIRLTEGDLKQIVKESVKKILKEETDFTQLLCYVLQAGAKQLKNNINPLNYFNEPDTDEDGYVKFSDDFEDTQIPFDKAKELFTPEGLEACKNGDVVYQWIIYLGNYAICSTKNFSDEDEVFDDCDKFINLLKGKCEAEVISLGFNKNGTVFSDVMFTFEEGSWMD